MGAKKNLNIAPQSSFSFEDLLIVKAAKGLGRGARELYLKMKAEREEQEYNRDRLEERFNSD